MMENVLSLASKKTSNSFLVFIETKAMEQKRKTLKSDIFNALIVMQNTVDKVNSN